ncbi:MAG: DUF4382 domain-containing protein [Halofilum sp. (in: g-proteobacteria)]
MRRPSRSIVLASGALVLFVVFVLFALTVADFGDDADRPGRMDLDLAGGTPRSGIREAWLEFSGLTVERADGTRVQHAFEEPRRIDLARLERGDAAELLEDLELPPGRYEWIQLHLNTRGEKDTHLVLADDSVRELVLPDKGRNHLRIETPFEVPPASEVKRTIDFHLHEPLGEKGPTSKTYALRPILRSVATETASHIKATAGRDLIARHCREPRRSGVALYVFEGDGVEPDDIGGGGADPVSVGAARMEDDDGPYTFHPAFLAPGDYMVALTCNAGGDKAEADDAFTFFATTEIRTEPGETVDHRFEDPEDS